LPRPLPRAPLFPYTTLFRSDVRAGDGPALGGAGVDAAGRLLEGQARGAEDRPVQCGAAQVLVGLRLRLGIGVEGVVLRHAVVEGDRKSTRLNSSHVKISYAV